MSSPETERAAEQEKEKDQEEMILPSTRHLAEQSAESVQGTPTPAAIASSPSVVCSNCFCSNSFGSSLVLNIFPSFLGQHSNFES